LVNLTKPSGTYYDTTILSEFEITDDEDLDTCSYNITRGASLDIDNTKINCSDVNATFIVSGSATYTMNLWANDSSSNGYTSSVNFIVATFEISSGGGGPSEQSILKKGEPLICNVSDSLWSLETEQGSNSYNLYILNDISKSRDLIFRNSGLTEKTINLICGNVIDETSNQTINFCDNIWLDNSTMVLQPNKEIINKVKVHINSNSDMEYGENYYFNIIASDGETCNLVMPFKVMVSRWAVLTSLFNTKQITITDDIIKIPIILIIFIPIIILSIILNLILKTPIPLSSARAGIIFICDIFLFFILLWVFF
jgi:hypothetical protein